MLASTGHFRGSRHGLDSQFPRGSGGDASLGGRFLKRLKHQEEIGGAAAGEGGNRVQQVFVLNPER